MQNDDDGPEILFSIYFKSYEMDFLYAFKRYKIVFGHYFQAFSIAKHRSYLAVAKLSKMINEL